MNLDLGEVDSWQASDAVVRDQLSSLQALLVLSMLMTERGSEHEIVELASTSVSSLGRAVFAGVFFLDVSWVHAAQPSRITERAALERQVEALGETTRDVVLDGPGWRHAFALRSLEGLLGYLVVVADEEPRPREQFLLRVLSRHAGVALANARAHAREQRSASELAAANAQLGRTVAALEQSIAIHTRLTEVAASDEGQQGIADAVHGLTKRAVAVEDRYGNLRAWAGPHRPHSYPKAPAPQRDALIRRMRQSEVPLRDGDRMLALAGSGNDILGVLVLIDPERTAGDLATVALEHGAAILAVELARLHSLAETELRLRRDLVDELVTGIDEERALARSQGLGYDLQRPHRVVLVRCIGGSFAEVAEYHAVRRAARDAGVGSLVGMHDPHAVVLSDQDQPWEAFRARVSRELGGGDCMVGVGGVCTRPSDYPASYHEAQLALRMQDVAAGEQKAVEYAGLGVYRLLADVEHPSTVEEFVDEWLGQLIEYDTRRGSSELVSTLSHYLECGGNYTETAKALSLHRNTLKYRLKRIRDISGRDLNDPNDRFNLQLATRAWQTLEALREQ